MKKQSKNLCWNVYWWDFNNDTAKVMNIFELNYSMNGELYKLRNCNNKAVFEKTLDNEIHYEMWARCEYEVGICENFPMIEAKELERLTKESQERSQYRYNVEIPGVKVDIYDQVKLNWDVFVNYCWENKKLFDNFKKSYLRLKEVRKYWRGVINGK